MAAEGVVEFVHREQAAHVHGIETVEPLDDLLAGAFRRAQELAAIEHLGGLHAEDHRHLALADHVPGLGRIGDDAEPALAGAAVLGVNIVLHGVHLLGLHFDRRHGVAIVLLLGVELTQHLVVHQMVDQDFQTGEMGPLDPAVVTLVMLQRVVTRPELIARPAFGGVGPGAAGDLLHQTGESLGAMIDGAVVQGMIDTEGMERVAVIHPAADELIGGNMAVRVDEAEHVIVVQPFHVLETGHLAQIVGRVLLGHGGVELRFRIGVTTLRGEQVETVGFALQRR